jgi:hypothetical protein
MRAKQDQKLEEVRAILQRLQRISAGAEEDETPVAPAHNGAHPAPNGSMPDRAAAQLRTIAGTSSQKKMAVIALPVFAVIGVAGALLWSLSGDETPAPRSDRLASVKAPPAPAEPERTAAVTPRPDSVAPERKAAAPVAAVPNATLPSTNQDTERLAVAQGLVDKGKITEARRVLNNDLASRNAEAALLLARCYDPNSLLHIANADAGPDPAEAERWYRRWSELAAAQGLELNPERLDRIIKAMR